MAGGNASPRQKMINMMYLVLTALLAINVSSEVLDAFVKANISLNQQNSVLISKNSGTYQELANQEMLNPKDPKYKQARAKAAGLEEQVKEVVTFIRQIKIDLLKAVDGVDEAGATASIDDPYLVNKKDDYDMPTTFFGTAEAPGNTGKAGELRKKLQAFKDFVAGIEGAGGKTFGTDSAAIKNLDILDLSDPDPNSNQAKKFNLRTWEMRYFYHLPLSAALLELAKWENAVRGLEAAALGYIWESISAQAFKFDAVEARVVPKSTFVVGGSPFEADVFLAAYNTSVKPTIVYGSAVDTTTMQVAGGQVLDTNNIVKGMGRISIGTSGVGERTFAGVIKVKKPGTDDEVSYPFSTKYNVSPPSASVAATNMNVFYRGLDNPISVSVPGFAPNQVSVTGAGPISIRAGQGPGNYIVSASGTGEAKVNVSVKTEDGRSISMGSQVFRVKSIPDPVLKWGNVRAGSGISGGLASQSPLIPAMENFDFNVFAKVEKFKIAYPRGGSYTETDCPGNTLPGGVASDVRGLKRGQKVFFSEVQVLMPDQTRRKLDASFSIQ